ncbi:RICIN domain-containing protein [Plantactinospora sp. GCM10030261]|uniref:RICIN domain-containing protein n=1 Tax=Plantactinospora sp. GCM10030261 TaxID=3273420 RepID=UPI00362074BB
MNIDVGRGVTTGDTHLQPGDHIGGGSTRSAHQSPTLETAVTTRTHRRLRRPVTALSAALLLAGSLSMSPATGHAAPPPQEPGVTLRVYDVQVPLTELCTVKPGQTPNVDKLMSTVNWTSAADFGFEDRFLAHVLGNVNIATAGSHAFRLTSDDGSRLLIDNSLVINHDGLHGPTGKEGAVDLGTGYHALRIEHFERDGGQQLTLEWKPPGATAFSVVPNSVLSTDAGVVRVTAPGRKECEGGQDSPGDGLPLTSVHPSYSLTNLRPAGFQPQVSAMDWYPDGRLAIATWGGTDNTLGEVYVLSNVTGSTGPGQVTTKKIASGLKEPMGIKVVDGRLYVSEKHRLTELVDSTGDGVTDTYRTVATWPFGGNFHEFAFGMLYQDGYFYLNLSVSINYGGATTDPQPAPNRGTTIKVHKDTGQVSYVAGGLRTPNGIGWGPEGGIFVTDNQGGWLPSSKLLHVKQGRFFNHYMNPAGPFDANPVTQPVLWLPQNEIANSPSTPIQIGSGTYAGQLLFGDVTYGGIQRAYLEKVGGEYQGAVFRLTQGLEAGVTRISLGPDGAIYAGGLGAGGNWGQEGKLAYGLQKLTPNGTSTFDILAMRAIDGGFELEYTQPLSTETATALATRYKVKQWRYQPTSGYGGPKLNEETLPVTSATLSADGRKVTLKLTGLQAGRVVYVRSPRPFSSASGQTLWSTEAWYTLNTLVGGGGVRSGPVVGLAGKCLDISNSGTADGTKVQLWTCNGTGAQVWTVQGQVLRNPNSNKCLDISNAGTADGTKVQLWTCNGTVAQNWVAQADGTLRNPNSAKCLDIAGNNSADGTQAQIWTCTGGANQRWTLP